MSTDGKQVFFDAITPDKAIAEAAWVDVGKGFFEIRLWPEYQSCLSCQPPPSESVRRCEYCGSAPKEGYKDCPGCGHSW